MFEPRSSPWVCIIVHKQQNSETRFKHVSFILTCGLQLVRAHAYFRRLLYEHSTWQSTSCPIWQWSGETALNSAKSGNISEESVENLIGEYFAKASDSVPNEMDSASEADEAKY